MAKYFFSSSITGNQAARYVNALFSIAGQPEPFDEAALAAMPRGIAFLTLGKQLIYTSLGSRFAVSQDLLAVYDAFLRGGKPDVDDVLGDDQTTWLMEGMTASTARWKRRMSLR